MEQGRSRSNRLLPRDITESLGKLPPQAIDMEEALLGAVMLESKGQAPAKAMQMLKPEHFYIDAHKEIFQAVVDLAKAGSPVDALAVKHQLEKNGKLELVGGAYKLASLTAPVKQTSDVEFQSLIIYEKYLLRELICIASEIHHDAYEGEDPHAIIEKTERFVRLIHESIPGGKEVKIIDELVRITEEIQKREVDVQEITGVPSGFKQIDRITLGWQPGDLILIAARPSMGKTALAVQSAVNTAVDFGKPVGIFSLEMSSYQLALRMTSIRTGMNMKTLRTKKFNPLDWDNFTNKTAKLAGAPIYIDDTGALSIMELRSRARRMVSRYGVKLIIIDYCQLMKGDTSYKGNREQEISSISGGCKAMAKELNVPVILLSQLSRDVEKRGGLKIPILSDLRDSGSLEQDADIVIFPWRPAYYKFEDDPEGRFVDGLTKIIIAKHRNGELGQPFLRFINYLTSFQNIDYAYEHQVPAEGNTQDVPHEEVSNALPPATMKIDPTKKDDDTPF
jgi:replicative DNA helicase